LIFLRTNFTSACLANEQDSHKNVEVWGFEPQASSLRTTRSTN
jgi:hypothetical protein